MKANADVGIRLIQAVGCNGLGESRYLRFGRIMRAGLRSCVGMLMRLMVCSVKEVIGRMVEVEEPGVVTREMERLRPVKRERRKWEESDVCIMTSKGS